VKVTAFQRVPIAIPAIISALYSLPQTGAFKPTQNYFQADLQAGYTLQVTVVATSNTQAVLAYTAPDGNPCVVQVSENSSLTPLVHDVDAGLFAGASSDSRLTSILSQTKRMFVVGKRGTELALDGKYYSRALQALTTHYYQVTCGSVSTTGSFRTTNIPVGNTYNEPPQVDPTTGEAVVPTFPPDRTTPVIDPQTGALAKSFWLPQDAPGPPYLYYSGINPMCSYQLVGPGPGYLCSFPTNDGGPGVTYYVVPATGEVRFLGQIWIPSGPDYPQGGSSAIGYPYIDPSSPLDIFTTTTDNAGHTVLLKATYSGDFTPVPPQGHASFTMINLTPEPHSLNTLISDFDPTFDPSKFSCGFRIGGRYGLLTCTRFIQDSYGWVAALDLGNRQPVGSCGSQCPHVIGAVNVVVNPQTRWCGLHSSGMVPNSPLAGLSLHGLTSSGLGLGPYQTKLTAPVGPSDTTLLVSGEPLNSADSIEPYLMDAAVGDTFQLGSEYVKIVNKISSKVWTVQRAYARSGSNPAQPWPTETTITANCESQPDAGWHDIWWKFQDDPHGAGNGYIAEGYVWGGHSDTAPNGRVMESYYGVMGPVSTYINTPPSWTMSTDPLFAGAQGWADGNSYSHYPSYQQWNASSWEQNWFLDEPTFYGANEMGPGANLISSQLYKYTFGAWGGLNRKQLATIAASGRLGLTDISGPGSVITGAGSDSYKYCVANVAGECIPNSQPGDAFLNVPNVQYRSCTGYESGAILDLCLTNLAGTGQSAYQFGFLPNTVALPPRFSGYGARYSRKLSGGFGAFKSLGRLFKPTPDGSWAFFVAGGAPRMLKLPPFPEPDGVDRSTFVRAPISISTPQGLGIAYAAIEFGYAEQGAPTEYFCTSRRESCLATSASVTDSNPFAYEQTDTYTLQPCATSCSITLPVLPTHMAYYQIKFYDSSGHLVALGDRGLAAEASAVGVNQGVSLAPPALSIASAHTGTFSQGQTGIYTVIVNNSGGPTTGTVIVTDTVPSGMSLLSISGVGWTCTGNSCSRTDTLSAALGYPAITVTVAVASNAASVLVNVVNVTGGGSPASTASDSTVIARPPASLVASGGNAQTAVVSTAFGAPLAVTVLDALNSPVSDVSVMFTAPTSGASAGFSGGTRTASTNAAGVATSPSLSANTIAGSYTVKASVPSLGSTVSFGLTNLAGPPTSIFASGGNSQSTAVNSAFGAALVVTLSDANGNPASGVPVTFTAPASGATAVFSGGTNTATTNAAGVATSPSLSANTMAGSYTVTASVQGVAAIASFNLTNTAIPGSACSGYSYSVVAGLDHKQIPSALNNFTIRISGTWSYLADIAHGGKVTSSKGYDICFSDMNNGIRYTWEMPIFDNTIGRITSFVLVPLVNGIASASDTQFRMWYGNSKVTTFQSPGPGPAWDSNYGPVYHFGDGQALSTQDATLTHNDAINSGAIAAPGRIDGAINFNDGAFVVIPKPPSGSAITIEGWIKSSDHTNGAVLYAQATSAGGTFSVLNKYSAEYQIDGIQLWESKSGGSSWVSKSIHDNAWHHFAIVIPNTNTANPLLSGNVFCYIDGVAEQINNQAGGGGFTLGASPATMDAGLTGLLEEVRLSNSARSAAWVTTEYTNQKIPQGLLELRSAAAPALLPMLGIAASHAASFTQGQQNAAYTVTVSNAAGAGATNGTATVSETLPAGLSLVSMAGSGWTCTGSSCTCSDALAAAASYPAITVTVNVAAAASSPLVNAVAVSGGGSASATASDTTTINALPVLKISSNHSGNFTQGQQNAAYTVTVSNAAGAGATNGTATVSETLPAGLSLVSMAGSGWTCTGSSCTRSDALAAAASYPPITVTVNVAAAASSPLVNAVAVSGGGSASGTASDTTAINAAAAVTAAVMQTPVPGTTLAGSAVTFTWNASGASAYWLDVGTVAGQGNTFGANLGTATSQPVTGIPTTGQTIHVKLWSLISGAWQSNAYTYTAANGVIPAVIQIPVPGTTLAGSAVTFTWNFTGAAAYWLDVGTVQGQGNIFGANVGTVTSRTVTGIPTNSVTIYVRLWSLINGRWQYNSYTYTAAGGVVAAVIQSPVPGSTLGASATFSWNATGASAYWLDVGTVPGQGNTLGANVGTATSQTVNGLPHGVIPIYVRLWSLINGVWQYNAYTYTSMP